MPPPGGEGFAALQSGAALAEGATAAYYNPAALAEVERSTGHAVALTGSHQRLLPVLGLPDLGNRFTGASLTLPDREGGTDLGIGLFRSHTNFGRTYETDAEGREIGFFDSRLGPWRTSYGSAFDGSMRSWAFDVSALYMPRFRIPGQPVGIIPSFGLVAANFGPDVFYAEALQADPIPTTYTAAAVTIDVAELLRVTAEAQAEQEYTRNTDGWSPIFNLGVSALLGVAQGGGACARSWAGENGRICDSNPASPWVGVESRPTIMASATGNPRCSWESQSDRRAGIEALRILASSSTMRISRPGPEATLTPPAPCGTSCDRDANRPPDPGGCSPSSACRPGRAPALRSRRRCDGLRAG